VDDPGESREVAPAYPVGADVTRRSASETETTAANRHWWDGAADAYQAEHGRFLGDSGFVWGPEGVREADAGLLGDLSGRRVLEVGCGAGQCGRALVSGGVDVVGVDLSWRQIRHAARINGRAGVALPVLQADAQRLPFPDEAFDAAFSSYGALSFVADAVSVLGEVARVLRPGGRFVYSVSHPVRWCFLDDPGEAGLVAVHPYFDRRAYVEQDDTGGAVYVEHHRTLGDWVRAIRAAGFVLDDLVEPEWPADNDQVWGGWSPLRGAFIPGTAIFVCRRP
jgi:SAM-dependent methyltransferase